MNMLILIMDIKPMVVIMDIELMMILVPSASPVFYRVLCLIKEVIVYNLLGLMKWRPYTLRVPLVRVGSFTVTTFLVTYQYIVNMFRSSLEDVATHCQTTRYGLLLFFILIFLPKPTQTNLGPGCWQR